MVLDGNMKALNVFYFSGEEDVDSDEQKNGEYAVTECELAGHWSDNAVPLIFVHTDTPSLACTILNAVETGVYIDIFETRLQKDKALEAIRQWLDSKDCKLPEQLQDKLRKWYLSETPCFRVYEDIQDKSKIPEMAWNMAE